MSTPDREPRQKGVIRELMRTPVFKDILRENLKAVHSMDGRTLIRALMEEDPEVFLGLTATIPSLANAFLGSLAELGERIDNQFSPGVLTAFMESLAGEIDVEAARRCGAAWKNIVSSLWEASPEFRMEIMRLALTAGPKVMADGINSLAQGVNSLERERPGTISSFMADMFSRLDRPGISNGTKTLAGAFLDQKWHLCSWLFGLALNRIQKRLGMRGSA